MPLVSTVAAGRFAPSPTGPLHLGSLIAALGSYLLARQAGLRWLLRIDDLDRPRVVPGAAEGILDLLQALGFIWDAEPLWQNRRTTRYAEVLAQLKAAGLVYPCSCSRREILASAPHRGEEGAIYPGTCRQGPVGRREQLAWRLRVEDREIRFVDGIYGQQRQNLAQEVGDFVLFRADGLFAYQLATIVDDLDSGVTQVVRGADLLGSTARQKFLYETLGVEAPTYWHLPLILGADGRKISKRHGDIGVVTRENGALMMQLALHFLGHSPPTELDSAPAFELLTWALEVFDPQRIEVRDLCLDALCSGGRETP